MGKLYPLFSRGFVFNVVELDKKLHKKILNYKKPKKKLKKTSKPIPKIEIWGKMGFFGVGHPKNELFFWKMGSRPTS